jgi:hypothetical protein
MTPQERALVTELFDRLATLEATRRDPEAERLIADGLARTPHATYALVQTTLLQDEALNRAQARIQELEESARTDNAPAGGGFLDAARESVLGRGRGSVPSVSPAAPRWNTNRADTSAANAAPLPNTFGQDAPRAGAFGGGGPFGGGSFLGTAAAAAVGVIGGNMLFNGLRNAMGGAQAQSFGEKTEGGADRQGPWGGDNSKTELANDAGVNDIGNGGSSRFADRDTEPSRLADDYTGDDSQPFDDDDDFFSDSDGGFGDGGFDT